VDNQSTVPLTILSRDSLERFTPETLPWVQGMPFPIDPFYGEIRHFADCVLHDRSPLTDGRESKRSLEVVLAAVKSASSGEPVALRTEA